MAVVVAHSFPFQRSPWILREFAAIHIERVTCSNFGFCFAERITIFSQLELFPISCSSSRLSYVPRFTKSGINRGFSPCLALVPFSCGPRNTCGSLSSRGRVVVFNACGFAGERRSILRPEEILPASLHFQFSSEFLLDLHR